MHPDIPRAVEALKAGLLVAFPTETVYGLGADASSDAALQRLYTTKGRPGTHPVIVHLARAEMLRDWARHVPPEAVHLAHRFWPGPLTLILPRAHHVSDRVTGGQDTVGLRCPAHPLALELLTAFGGGLAAPSANRFGHVSPTTAQHVRQDLGDDVALVLDGGACPVGVESAIVDLSGDEPRLLRPGMLTRNQLEHALGRPLAAPAPQAPRVPGALERHYSPRTPALLVPPEAVEGEARRLLESGAPAAVLARRPAPPWAADWIQAPEDPEGYARGLYAALRDLDERDRALILIEEAPSAPDWDAIRDRLRRAAQGFSR